MSISLKDKFLLSINIFVFVFTSIYTIPVVSADGGCLCGAADINDLSNATCIPFGEPIGGGISSLVSGPGQCELSGCKEYAVYANTICAAKEGATALKEELAKSSSLQEVKKQEQAQKIQTGPLINIDLSSLNPLGTTSPETLIARGISILMGVLGSIALVMFIYGGVLWMTAAGKPDQVKKGFSVLVWGALGVMVIFASYAIVTFVFSAFL